MKKRLNKKQGNKYNLSKYVKRQMHKRKGGQKYITYQVIPMGEKDKSDFNNGYGPDFPFATHWFVEVYYHNIWKDYIVRIYPCTSKGRINERYSYIRIVSFKKREEIIAVFEKIVDDMKNDNFMKVFDTYYYDDLLF
jgi:hypothetical protein